MHDYERSPYGLGWEHARRGRRGRIPFPYGSRRYHDYRQGAEDFRSHRYQQAGEEMRAAYHALLGTQPEILWEDMT